MITSKTFYVAISLYILLTSSGMATWFDITGEAPGLLNDEINTCAWGDYDNDGDMDLFAGNSQTRPGSYLYENIAGNFIDRAADAGVQFLGRNAQASAWGDCDNDGLLDLYVVNVNAECEMYKNVGGCAFYDQACVPGEDIGGAHGGVARDIDNDGDLDIFVANVAGDDHNRLYRNFGDWIFAEEAMQSNIGIPEAVCYSGSFSDYNFDGDLDLFITAYDRNYLFRNDGEDNNGFIQFVDVTSANGITDPTYSPGSAWGDFDLDGDSDLYIASLNPNEFYRNGYRQGLQLFERKTDDAGVGDAAMSLSTEWADYNSEHLFN
jgi:hypothetical protein